MAVRNFYVEGHVDGRKTDLTGGPVNREGGMRLFITQRENGSIVPAFTIRSWVRTDGRLGTTVSDRNGNVIGNLITDR
jgi:hypothetical protein